MQKAEFEETVESVRVAIEMGTHLTLMSIQATWIRCSNRWRRVMYS